MKPIAWLKPRLTRRDLPLVLALIAMALASPSIWIGLQGDDYAHKAVLQGHPDTVHVFPSRMAIFDFASGDPSRVDAMMDIGLFPWWTYREIRLNFWRPLTVLTHWADYNFWPSLPWLMHVQSLLWFGAMIVAASLLYRRLMGPTWIAGFAALLYALDDAHGTPAGWLANRNALIATLFGLLALIFHDRWRKDCWRAGMLLGPLCLGLSLLGGEMGLGACAYLFAYFVFLDRTPWPRRVASFLPYVAVGVLWMAYYREQGYGAWGSALYVDPVRQTGRFALAVLIRAPVLWLGQWGWPPASPFVMLSPIAKVIVWTGAFVLLAWIKVVLVPILWRNRLAAFWTVGMALSLLPVCATFPNDRLLLFTGLGAFGLIAQFFGMVVDEASTLPSSRVWKSASLWLFRYFIVIHLIMAPITLPIIGLSNAALGLYTEQEPGGEPWDETIRDQTVLLVNPPAGFFSIFLTLIREERGQPTPAHVRVIAPGFLPIAITRVDARTLVVRPEGGYLSATKFPGDRPKHFHPIFDPRYMIQDLDRVFRDDEHPMELGESVELTGVTILITAVTTDARPSEVTFTFDVPLEDASLRWLQWKDGVYVRFELPAVGETVFLEPLGLPLL